MQMTRSIRCAVVACALALAAQTAADEIVLVDTLPGTFIDIADIGTPLDIGDEDEVEIQTTIGNGLLPAGSVIVANNGGIGFDPPGTDLARDNEEIPSEGAFGGGQALLAYWDDIGNDVGGVLWLELDDKLIIQWEDRLIEPGGARATFQIQVFDASEATNPYFQFLYEDIEAVGGGASATIGYQDGGAGFEDDQWSFDTEGVVVDGGVLSVLPEPHSILVLLLGFAGLRRQR